MWRATLLLLMAVSLLSVAMATRGDVAPNPIPADGVEGGGVIPPDGVEGGGIIPPSP
jgi:hypothetical protein